MKDVEEKLPSLPIAYWTKHKAIQAQANSKTKQCAKYPSIFDLHFNNIYWQVRHQTMDLAQFLEVINNRFWQTLQTTNGTFQLFGAYYDVRKNSKIGPAVRILGNYRIVDLRSPY